MSDYTERRASLFKLYRAARNAKKWREAFDFMTQIEQHQKEYELETVTPSGAIVTTELSNHGVVTEGQPILPGAPQELCLS